MNKRIEYIDRAKGIAIQLVVIGHLMAFCTDAEKNPIYTVIASFHMPLFIFLSGLVLSTPPRLLKAVNKIVYLLLPMVIIGLIFTYCIGKGCMDFITDNFKNGYWYLYVLSVYYMLLTVFNLTKRFKYSGVLDIVLAVIFFGSMKFLCLYLSKATNNLLSLDLCANLWPYFIGGHLIRKYRLIDTLLKADAPFAIALVLYIPLLLLYESGTFVRFSQVVSITSIIGLLHLLYHRKDTTSRIERGLTYLGKHTLDIYIFHYFLLQIIDIAGFGRWVAHSGNYLIELIALISLSIIVSLGCIGIGYVIRISPILSKIIYGRFVKA